jgi:hypothetical protein
MSDEFRRKRKLTKTKIRGDIGRGNRMSPTHANKRGVRYRYYVSHAILQNRKAEAGNIARVPAPEIETLVCEGIRTNGVVRSYAAARSLGIPSTIGGDRDSNPQDTPFVRLIMGLESFLPPDMQSESLAACAKRIERSPAGLRHANRNASQCKPSAAQCFPASVAICRSGEHEYGTV